jgi:hypothetical protein
MLFCEYYSIVRYRFETELGFVNDRRIVISLKAVSWLPAWRRHYLIGSHHNWSPAIGRISSSEMRVDCPHGYATIWLVLTTTDHPLLAESPRKSWELIARMKAPLSDWFSPQLITRYWQNLLVRDESWLPAWIRHYLIGSHHNWSPAIGRISWSESSVDCSNVGFIMYVNSVQKSHILGLCC